MYYKDLMKDPEPIGGIYQGIRIYEGIRDITITDTAFFVELSSIPKDRKIIYGKLVCD
jgi:hypothetical protein